MLVDVVNTLQNLMYTVAAKHKEKECQHRVKPLIHDHTLRMKARNSGLERHRESPNES